MRETKDGKGLLAEARRVDAEVREIGRRRNRDAIAIARRLLDMKERGLATALGFASVAAYAEHALGYSGSKTRELVALAEKLRELPASRETAEKGELPWTKLRTISRVATRENERSWLEKGHKLSNRKLELAVAKERGEEPLETLVIKVTATQKADIEDAALAVLREEPTLTFDAALAEACRRSLAKTARKSPCRVVVTTCAECKKAARETREGAISVAPAEVERVTCDGEVLDVRGGPAPLRRTIPPKVANFVEARDKGRCRVPGCTNRAFIDHHHEGGWLAVGHDPAHVFLLCTGHHSARHSGDLLVEGTSEDLHFSLADGTPLAEADASRDALRACVT